MFSVCAAGLAYLASLNAGILAGLLFVSVLVPLTFSLRALGYELVKTPSRFWIVRFPKKIMQKIKALLFGTK